MAETKWSVSARDVAFGASEDQVWIEDDERFTKVVVGTNEYAAASRDAQLLGAMSCPRCADGALPSNFKYCPDCGAQTEPAAQVDEKIGLSHSPSFGATGWPETPRNLLQLKDREAIRIEGGDWGLAVAGKTRVLLALDYEHGRILRYDGRDTWEPVARSPSPGLQPWQRSIIASDRGMYFAVEAHGVGYLPTPFVTGAKIALSTTALGESRPAGGLCLLGNSALLPAYADGKLRLEGAWLTGEASNPNEFWRAVAVSDPADLGEEAFGAPFTNAASDVFWSARNSYVAVAKADRGEELTPRRFRWRDGFSALPATRPFRWQRGGTVWQLGIYQPSSDGERQYAFHAVTISGTRQDIHVVDGPHLAFGQGSFRGDKRYEEPWGEPVVDYDPASNDSVFVPVAVSGNGDDAGYLAALVDGREKLADLVTEHGAASACPSRLCTMSRFLGSLNQLQLTLNIQSPHDLSAAIYGDKLLIYSRCENKIFQWSIAS